MPSCPYCAARGSEHLEAAGTGSVYSWIVVRRAFNPAFAGDVPYVIATIDLDEGCRILARLDAEPAFELPVKASYIRHDGWTELRFTSGAGQSA